MSQLYSLEIETIKILIVIINLTEIDINTAKIPTISKFVQIQHNKFYQVLCNFKLLFIHCGHLTQLKSI